MSRFTAPRAVRRSLGSLATLVVAFGLFATIAVASGFVATLIANQNNFSSATLQVEGTVGSNHCYSSGTGSGGTVAVNSSVCTSGSPVPSGSLSSASSSSATTTLSSPGTTNASAANLALASCGVASLADVGSDSSWSGSGSNTALPLGGLTYQASGPLSSQAITTNGTTGWAETIGQYANPQTFTVLAWFKTSSATGSIIGFSNNQTQPTLATTFDRMLWIDPTGHLVWAGTYPYEITSSGTYADGAWHFVAVAESSTGTQLYVDGAQVGFSNYGAQNYNGWWSLGVSSVDYNYAWADRPTSAYFNGSLAQIAILPSQLNSTQVSNLYGDTTLANYTSAVNALSPVNDWQFNDSGGIPYEGSIPGQTASTTLTDASGYAHTGAAQGGVTLGASGPGTLGADAISLDGSSGWVQTNGSFTDPVSFSIVAWFKTTTTLGGNIIAFTDTQGNGTPGAWDRLLWVDNSGNLVWAVNPGGSSPVEILSPSAYNDGAWHMVVAEIGAAGQQLWVDGTEVASNSSVTSAQNYTGYWHLGWGDEQYWYYNPTSAFLNGSLSQVAVISGQLSSAQISTLYNASSTAALTLDVAALSPVAYWPLQDSASNVCGTTEVTVQQTVGSTNTCVLPSAAGACAAPTSALFIRSLGVRSFTAPTSSTPVSITITLELSAASPAGVLGLHELADISFGTTKSSTLWSAQVAYPYGWSQL